MAKPIEERILSLREVFGSAYDRARDFELHTYSAQILSSILCIAAHPEQQTELSRLLLEEFDELEDRIDTFLDAGSTAFGGVNGYQYLITEKSFLDRYAVFEKFIKDVFIEMGLEYPALFLENRDIVKLSWKEVFSNQINRDVKEIIIENVVRETLMAKSFDNAIIELGRKFNLNIKNDIPNVNEVFFVSKLRNIMVHNSGFMTSQDVHMLKARGFSISVEPGESIVPYVQENNEELRSLLGDFAHDLYELVRKELPRLTIEVEEKGS